MPNRIDDYSSDRRTTARRRLWWRIAAFAVLVVVTGGAIVFEAITGRFSGTVMQVRIDECTRQELLMSAFIVPGSSIELMIDGAAEESTTMPMPAAANPLTARLRVEVWKSAGRVGAELNGLGKPGTLVVHVKTGDVFELQIDETVKLMSWESIDSTERRVMVAYVEP